MKIIVIGAGEGGIAAAHGLATGGHGVTVYEKNKREDLGYDWHDDVSQSLFTDLGIAVPDDCFFVKKDWSFIAPSADKWIKISQSQNADEYSVERRPLKDILIKRAEEAGVEFVFGQKIERLIIENTAVKGAVTQDGEIRADIVIDSSGALSPFRASLPRDIGIPSMPASYEIFHAYRGFFEKNPDEETDTVNTNKAYLKFLGRSGIAWCIQDSPTGQFNVLIGQTGALTQNDLKSAFAFLKQDNPALTDKLIRGGITVSIPVRYPASKMVADGYALVGDAAFMTIPMLGSGIASSIRAGKLLAETINKNLSAAAAGLWDYQVGFMTATGAKHAAIDILKRWLLDAKDEDLKYLMESGLIAEKDFNAAASGEMLVFKPYELIQKALSGRDNLPLLLKLKSLISKSKSAYKCGMNIPVLYDAQAVSAWQKKFDGIFD
ncbi:MAG: NAD(P)/FAD-dependent oxidoreductase [Clostridiales bacterium]|jgi:flavin-dependent dehydrogenase|nr:NAD(P)/FAD-dependent oxidoreductase [Clostridiales bacterium]